MTGKRWALAKFLVALLLHSDSLSVSQALVASNNVPRQVVRKKSQRGRSVEKLDLETGEVLESFPTIVTASKSMGMKTPTSLYQALSGDPEPTWRGFRWRAGKQLWTRSSAKEEGEIEQLDLETGQVLQTFSSLKEATNSMAKGHKVLPAYKGHKVYPAYINRVVEGTRTSYAGFFWRRKGSNALPETGARARIPIEKVCLQSGKVLGVFRTKSQAARSVGIIRLAGTGILPTCAGGFFWRRQGSNNMPPTADERAMKGPKRKAVEKLCLETKEVLETFPSIKSAANSVSATPTNVLHVLKGRCKSCRGFFWRYKGSNALPVPRQTPGGTPRPRIDEPVEQICVGTGELLATYGSHKEAALAVEGTAEDISSVVKGGRKSHRGYFWRPLGSDAHPEPRRRPVAQQVVEQLSMDTGEVINTFQSIAEAARLTDTTWYGISNVLRGKASQSNSFYWRQKGSTDLPYTVEQ